MAKKPKSNKENSTKENFVEVKSNEKSTLYYFYSTRVKYILLIVRIALKYIYSINAVL